MDCGTSRDYTTDNIIYHFLSFLFFFFFVNECALCLTSFKTMSELPKNGMFHCFLYP